MNGTMSGDYVNAITAERAAHQREYPARRPQHPPARKSDGCAREKVRPHHRASLPRGRLLGHVAGTIQSHAQRHVRRR